MNKRKALKTVFVMCVSVLAFAGSIALMIHTLVNDELWVRSWIFYIGLITSIAIGSLMWMNFKKK